MLIYLLFINSLSSNDQPNNNLYFVYKSHFLTVTKMFKEDGTFDNYYLNHQNKTYKLSPTQKFNLSSNGNYNIDSVKVTIPKNTILTIPKDLLFYEITTNETITYYLPTPTPTPTTIEYQNKYKSNNKYTSYIKSLLSTDKDNSNSKEKNIIFEIYKNTDYKIYQSQVIKFYNEWEFSCSVDNFNAGYTPNTQLILTQTREFSLSDTNDKLTLNYKASRDTTLTTSEGDGLVLLSDINLIFPLGTQITTPYCNKNGDIYYITETSRNNQELTLNTNSIIRIKPDQKITINKDEEIKLSPNQIFYLSDDQTFYSPDGNIIKLMDENNIKTTELITVSGNNEDNNKIKKCLITLTVFNILCFVVGCFGLCCGYYYICLQYIDDLRNGGEKSDIELNIQRI